MIDTIRFSIPIDESVKEAIIKKSEETRKIDINSGETKFKFYNSKLNLGSYDRFINLFISENFGNYCYLELSLPKFKWGHNIWLIYESDFEPLINKLYKELEDYFGIFTPWKKWIVNRLDICYAWKLENQTDAELMLNIMKSFNYKRKHTERYESSVFFKGTSYSIKEYLKKPEFYCHDFQAYKKSNPEYGYNVLEWCDGVLRFEVTLRKDALKQYFKKDPLYFSDIGQGHCLTYLQFFYNQLMGGIDPKLMTTQEALEALKMVFNREKAIKLWQFYRLYRSEDSQDQEILKNNYNRSTIWRNLHDLKIAGVGLPKRDMDKSYQLTIPSNLVVNLDPADPASGGGKI